MRTPVRPNSVTSSGLRGLWNQAAVWMRPLLLAVALILSGTASGRTDSPPLQPPTTAADGGSWIDAILAPLGDLSRWVSGLFSHDERLVTDEIERFKHSVDTDLSGFDALVREAGFTLASVSVGARLEPQISVSMTFRRRLGEPEKTALMTKITDPAGGVDTVQRSVIMILLNAAESTYAVRNDGFRLSQVTIDLDTIPKVTLTMTPFSHWP